MTINMKSNQRTLHRFLPHSSSCNNDSSGKKSASRFQTCPICCKSFPNHVIESHAANCLDSTNKHMSICSPSSPVRPQNIQSTTYSPPPSARLWEQIMCPLCKLICVKAHIANPCGHVFCASCIANLGQEQQHIPCPKCRELVINFTWLRPYDQMIRNLLFCRVASPESQQNIQQYMHHFIQGYEQDGLTKLTSQERDLLSSFYLIQKNMIPNTITAEKVITDHGTISSLPIIEPKRLLGEKALLNNTNDHHKAKSFLVWKQPKMLLSNPLGAVDPMTWSEPIPGLFVFEQFITEIEELTILKYLDEEAIQWKMASFNGPHFGKRWGVHCNLRDRKVSAEETPLPLFFQNLLHPKVKALLSCSNLPPHLITMIQEWTPNEANAIRYHKKMGHCLSSHCDDRKLSKELIANLSLEGDCYMTYKNEKWNKESLKRKQEMIDIDNADQVSPEILLVPGRKTEGVPFVQIPSFHHVLLKRRTLQLLTGRARYDYSHGICNHDFLDETRVSITMRESPMS